MTITNTFATSDAADRLSRLAAIHRKCLLKLQPAAGQAARSGPGPSHGSDLYPPIH